MGPARAVAAAWAASGRLRDRGTGRRGELGKTEGHDHDTGNSTVTVSDPDIPSSGEATNEARVDAATVPSGATERPPTPSMPSMPPTPPQARRRRTQRLIAGSIVLLICTMVLLLADARETTTGRLSAARPV